jgi:hypothetical protein
VLAAQWAHMLTRRKSIASASFTPSRAARKHLFPAGAHERDMFLSIADPTHKAIMAVLSLIRIQPPRIAR